VAIITGSDIGVNYFKHITQPVRFKVEMLNQKEDLNKLDSFSSHAANVLAADPTTPGDIPELITELDQLRKRGIITDQEFQVKKADLLRRI
jgi:hypothetical protein